MPQSTIVTARGAKLFHMLVGGSVAAAPTTSLFFFFFNDTAPTEISPLPLHAALPISFNPTTGSWTYTLDQSLADPLTAGQVVHDHLVVTSFDGTASHDIDVTITGSNDNATISVVGSQDTARIDTRRNSNHTPIPHAAFGLKKKKHGRHRPDHFPTPPPPD